MGGDVVPVSDRAAAWDILRQDNAPPVAILDWMMPEMTGIEVCRSVRQLPSSVTYLIILTSKDEKGDIVAALEAGADDHIAKPFTPDELRARLQVGERIIRLQETWPSGCELSRPPSRQVKQLQGLLPMCAYCRRSATIRATGSGSGSTSASGPRPPSATESARVAARRSSRPSWNNGDSSARVPAPPPLDERDPVDRAISSSPSPS
jgi:CheY-like chemotaxis protein